MKKIILILFLFCTLQLWATDRYVSTTGSNSNSGTIGSPWLTLAYACSHSTSGDLVHIGTGTFVESTFCQPAVGVSFVGNGVTNTFVTLTYASNAGIYISSGSIVNGNQSISGIYFSGNNLVGYSAITVDKVGGVSIHDCSFVNFARQAVRFTNSSAPSSYVSGNSFYNNTIINSAAFDANGSPGALYLTGQNGLLCYNNTITLPKRGTVAAGFGIKTNYTKSLQVYNNTINLRDNDDGSAWAFAMELWNTSNGCRIYNNRFRGAVDFAGNYTVKGDSSFSCKLYNNIFGHDTLQSVARKGILLECEADTLSNLYIYDNEFRNLQSGVSIYTLAASKFKNIYIYRNWFHGIGATINNYWGNAINGSGNAGFTLNNLYIWNNTMVADRGDNSLSAIMLNCKGTVTNVYIKNNIIKDFGTTYLTSNTTASGTINLVYVQYNGIYGCGASNEPAWGAVTPTNITKTNILKVNPIFVSTTDFRLQSTSPYINVGIDVGLPYSGASPDLGAFEYGSVGDIPNNPRKYKYVPRVVNSKRYVKN